MKPLTLKIKGINSFIEEQVIDFERLIKNGFFGIFGSTGSGKTTILDGITLALYGKTSRKSENFINTNGAAGNVSYEFQISGAAAKIYRVEREFKLDKKTGKPHSGKCKIIEFSEGVEEVLADSVSTVNHKCEEIIGLSCDDFTRTVVLPQGKFSDFLNLKGTERNDMLERLFRLEQYGDELTYKLKRRITLEGAEIQELQGRINAYGEISKEVCQAKQDELMNAEQQYKIIASEYVRKEAGYKEMEEVKKLQDQLENYTLIKQELESRQAEINQEQWILKQAKQAEAVIPYIKEWDKVKEERKKAEMNLIVTKKEYQNSKTQKEEIEKQYIELSEKREHILPELLLKENRIMDAIRLQDEADQIQREISSKLQKKEELLQTITKVDTAIQSLKEAIDEKSREKELTEDKKSSSKIDLLYKERVQQGLLLEREYKTVKASKDKYEKEIAQKEKDYMKLISEREHSQKQYDCLKGDLDKEAAILDEYQKNPPLSIDELHILYDNLSKMQNEQKIHQECMKELQFHEKEEKRLGQDINKVTQSIEGIKQELDVLQKEKQEFETKNLADQLRKGLIVGEHCPVCGSICRHIDIKESVSNPTFRDFDKRISHQTECLNQKTEILNENRANFTHSRKIIEEKNKQIRELNQMYLESDVESLCSEYQEKKEAQSIWQKNTKETEEQVKRIESDCIKQNNRLIQLDAQLEEQKKGLEFARDEFIQITEQFSRCEKQYLTDMLLIKADSFDDEMNCIKLKETTYERLEKKSAELDKEITDLKASEDTYQQTRLEHDKTILVASNDIVNRERELADKRKGVFDKVGDVKDIKQYQETISGEIVSLNQEFEEIKQKKEQVGIKYSDYEKRYEHEAQEKIRLEEEQMNRTSAMEKQLTESGFDSCDQVRGALLDAVAILQKEQQIEQYVHSMITNQADIDRIHAELNGRSISTEEWKTAREALKDLAKKKEDFYTNQIALRKEIEALKEKLVLLEETLDQKARHEHTKSMLNELDKLFRGKKFVQFVAAERLKYISRAASKTLLEISSGGYELLTNDKGEFIIKDYRNGGSIRDASTLSGGEVFMVSLSLALALSNQIQLTNHAPLELFFLDEGFGTLDDQLLDEVITALEKLQNSRRAIGVISHVTEIQNRVPIQLVISSPQIGKCGSRVKVQLS